MSLRIYTVFFLVIFGSQLALVAQSSASSPNAVADLSSAPSASLRGHVSDPTGALIPGAKITLTNGVGKTITSVTADSTGGYEVHGLKPGTYVIFTTAQGFAPSSSKPLALMAGQVKHLDVALTIQTDIQTIVVSEDTPTVSVEAAQNSSAIVLKGKDLDALSDDPDELQSELMALAGPSAGPNGGQIFIDGFTGGELPPKSAIREIRINQNPFSAEFDKLGYGRIEIFTKPGTDKLRGQVFAQGNDDAFNTGNPFTKVLPTYHSIQFNGTVSGPISKSASYFISAEQRNNQNDSVYTLAQAPVLASDPTVSCGPPWNGQTCVVGSVSGGLFNPQTRTNIAPRIDLQLGKKNTLTARYQFYRNSQSGQIGSTSLPSLSATTTSTESTLQISNSMIITDHIVNETRFQFLRDYSTTTPASTDPLIAIPGVFTGGGSSGQSTNDHTTHYELQNLTTMSIGSQAIKFGTRLRDNRDANYSNANYNGSFTFNDITDYVGALNLYLNNGTPCPVGANCAPTKLTYTSGPKAFTANLFDAAVFFQDDWKVNRNLTLSGGLRWESENHIADHSDWAPRVSFAYALDGHKDKKQAKTVLRGGYGIFYDRFSLGNKLNTLQLSGLPGSQTQTTITNPTCFDPSSPDFTNGNCAPAVNNSSSTVDQIAPNYHSPYTQQFGTSLERQLTKTTTLTVTYLHSFGVHQLVTRDSNAYRPGTFTYGNPPPARPDTLEGIVDQYYPEAVFKQNQIITNINARISPKLSIVGFYNFTVAHSDGGGSSNASNSYNISQDYARASFASRSMVFLTANYTAPWAIHFSPFLIAESGKPFNLVTPYDLSGDNFFNDRPSYATASSNPANVYTNNYGSFDAIPQVGETIIPANLGNGPAAVAVNLRVSRTWGFGPKNTSTNNQNDGGPPPGGPPGGGHGGGPGGGPGGGGGFGFGGGPGGHGGPGRGDTKTDKRYNLTFSAQALNLFNDIDYGTPIGNVTAQNFGKSTSLAGGIFSSGAAARRIFFQTTFAF